MSFEDYDRVCNYVLSDLYCSILAGAKVKVVEFTTHYEVQLEEVTTTHWLRVSHCCLSDDPSKCSTSYSYVTPGMKV
jgi:hypothetical protein